MEAVEALHTAARRYAADRGLMWHIRGEHIRLEEKRRTRRRGAVPDHTESSETHATGLRYHVLRDIEAAVEEFTPADFASLEEARELLDLVGASAEGVYTRPPNGEIQQRAIDEERELFRRHVRGLTNEELAGVEPLPFRRTLTTKESTSLRSELERRWGVKDYWYPIDRPKDAEPPPHTVAFNADAFDEGPERHLRNSLHELDVSRLLELREYVDTYNRNKEIEPAEFRPWYTGAEGFWTDKTFDWLVYASHESSVTIAGKRLLQALKLRWPHWSQHRYNPPWYV